jgi:cytidylate kinase
MDGRDIGSIVLPDANIKIYLTASAEARARRRYDELISRGVTVDYETVLREVNERDERDMNRAIAPARPAPDADTIDTTDNSLEDSIIIIENYIRERLAAH